MSIEIGCWGLSLGRSCHAVVPALGLVAAPWGAAHESLAHNSMSRRLCGGELHLQLESELLTRRLDTSCVDQRANNKYTRCQRLSKPCLGVQGVKSGAREGCAKQGA